MTVAEWLGDIGAKRSAAPALVGVDRQVLTWSSLLDQVRSIGASLHSEGVGAGDIVLIALPDGPDALTAILGATSVAAAFPVSDHEQIDRYEQILGDIDVRAIICAERLRQPMSDLAAKTGVALFVVTPDAGAAGRFRLSVAVSGRRPSKVDRQPTLDDPAILIATSGTTAAAKVVSSSHASIFASITHCAEWLSLSHDDRSLCVMPFAHLHGIVRSTLPALISGGTVICTPGLDRSRVLDWISTLRPTFMTAAPSIYRILLQRIAEAGWQPAESSLRLLVTGSDSIDQSTIAEVERVLGVPLLQFYGLSEVAPLIAVRPADGTLVARGAVGKINPVWSVACLDETGNPVAAGAEGEIALKGGFINPLVGAAPGTQRMSPDGRLLTGDLGIVDENESLFVTGRVDDRIHSGGRKINPQTVEELLLQHPAVMQALAFGVPDPVLGQRVGALVVLAPTAIVGEADLQTFLAGRAFSYMVPERIVIAHELPTNAAGKLTRSTLAERLELTGRATVGAGDSDSAPGDDVEEKLAELFANHLKLAHVDRTSSFFEIGGDSFAAIEILFEIEDRFGVRIPPATFTGHPSVSLLAGVIRNASRSGPSAHMLPLRAEGRFPPLFVAYNVEGNVGYGDAIRGALGPNQPLYAFNTLASRNDAAKPERLEEQAAALVESMRSVQPRGPYDLIGYSFGSHLALEVAQQIFDQRESVAFLGVIDDSADLGRRQFAVEKRPPAKLTTEACNRWAIERYVPKPYPGKVTLFRASEPAEIYQSDPLAGWGDIALGGVEAHDIPGDHESVVTSEGFRWGPLLEICLAKARHRTSALGRRIDAEASKAVRHARSIATNKGSRHTIDARVAAKQGDRQTEIREYRKALQVATTQPLWVQRNLAEALIESGDTASGLALYEAALAADPWPFWSLVQLANLKLSLNRSSEIPALYERGRELVADDPDIMRHWGHLCTLAGKLDEAEGAIRRAIVLEKRKVYAQPYLGDLHGYLSDILASRGRLAEALAAASEALRIDPKDPKKMGRVAKLRARASKLDPVLDLNERDKTRPLG